MTVYNIAFPFGEDEEFRSLEWSFEDGQLLINGEPAEGLEYLIGYGLKQSLADSWSGHSKDKAYDKAGDAYDKRLTAIIEGTIESGTRASNPIAVEVGRLARLAVEKAVKAKYKS